VTVEAKASLQGNDNIVVTVEAKASLQGNDNIVVTIVVYILKVTALL